MSLSKQHINNIIVGVDFSDYSHLVVKQAIKFADETKAKLSIVFARDLWVVVPHAKKYRLPETAIFEDKQILEALKKVYALRSLSNVDYIVEHGEPASILIQQARRMKNALIIVGSMGSGAIGRFFLGSVAEKLALESPFPVWIHKGNRVTQTRNTLMPLDLSKQSEKTIENLSALFDKKTFWIEGFFVESDLPAAWHLEDVHALYEMDKKLAKRFSYFQAKHPDINMTKAKGSINRHILQAAKSYDFLTMAHYHRADLPQSYGAHTLKIIRHATVPVLVINPKASRPTKKPAAIQPMLTQPPVYDPYFESH